MARELGYKSRERMLRDLTSREYFEWVEVFSEQPVGVLRDERNAMLGIQFAVAIATHGKHWIPLEDLCYASARNAVDKAMENQSAVTEFLENTAPMILGPDGKVIEVEE